MSAIEGERVAGAQGEPGGFSPTQAMWSWMQAIAPYGIFLTDSELRIRSWNDWLVAHSGRSAQEVVGRPLSEVYPSLAERRLDRSYVRALAGEVVVLSTALHKYLLPFPGTAGSDGFPPMRQTARIAPLREESEVVGTITVIEDVTQREVQAAVLQRQQEIDRLLSASLAILLQSSNPSDEMAGIFSTLSPVVALDVFLNYLPAPDGRTLRLHSAGGLLPKQREALAVLPLDAAAQQALRGASAPTEIDIAGHVGILRGFGVRAQGSFPLLGGDRMMGLVVFGSYRLESIPASDLSILSRVARYIAVALDRALREREILTASRAKDDFLAAFSHELRTPLNPVLLLSSDASLNPDYPAEAREAFRAIEKNVMLEARLIDDLLDLTRIEHGKLGLVLQVIDLHAALRDALATVQADAAEKHLSVQVDLRAADSRVMGDAGRLQQVFWNVLKNSTKFTPAGGQIWVATETDPGTNEITVKIADTGIGMDEKELARVFEAFAQGDHAASGGGHRFGGLGLGLAISRKLIESHRGRIEAASAGKQQGSTFTIRIPLLPPAPEVKSVGANRGLPGAASPAAAHPRKARILLVEDHDPSRATLTRVLERHGYEVTAVATSATALQAASVAAFDLVISDVGLPDASGLELMRKLRDDYGAIGIALTGYGMDGDIARTRAAGFFAHLTKPVNAEALKRVLESVPRKDPSADGFQPFPRSQIQR